MTTRPPPAEPSATPDPPDTRQTTPPTISYRHPELRGAGTGVVTGTRRSRDVAEHLPEPSPSDQELTGPEAEFVAPAPAGLALAVGANPALSRPSLSRTAQSPVNPMQQLLAADINTTQRSHDEPISSPRLIRDDGRTARIEEQLVQLDARLRLLHKSSQRLERLVVLALILGALSLAFSLFR